MAATPPIIMALITFLLATTPLSFIFRGLHLQAGFAHLAHIVLKQLLPFPKPPDYDHLLALSSLHAFLKVLQKPHAWALLLQDIGHAQNLSYALALARL